MAGRSAHSVCINEHVASVFLDDNISHDTPAHTIT